MASKIVTLRGGGVLIANRADDDICSHVSDI